VSPAFVDWIAEAPSEDDNVARQLEAHRLIAARSREWTSDHRCWLPDAMPLFTYDNVIDTEIAAALLGVDADRFHTRESRRQTNSENR